MPETVFVFGSDKLALVNAATGTVGKVLNISNPDAPEAGDPGYEPIAVADTRKTVYINDDQDNMLLPIETATNTVGKPIHITVGFPSTLAVTP